MFPSDRRKVLEKGHNFAIAPKKIPIEKIISGVEATVSLLEEKMAEEIRGEVSRVLRKTKPPKSNLTVKEEKALRALKQRDDILVLPADKGNSTVVMKKIDYIKKIEDVLNDGPYEELKEDPTGKINRRITQFLKENKIETVKSLIRSDPISPRIYGLPKILYNSSKYHLKKIQQMI